MAGQPAILKQEYKGFEIYFSHSCQQWNHYYAIFKDGERFSSMALISAKACRNVIDTYLRSLKR